MFAFPSIEKENVFRELIDLIMGFEYEDYIICTGFR